MYIYVYRYFFLFNIMLNETLYCCLDSDQAWDASSQADLFANTQIPMENENVKESQPGQWADTKLEFPWLILFLWGGQRSPFVLTEVVGFDPQEIDGKWLSGILSPKSRTKLRNFSKYPDYSVSLFGKVHKGLKHFCPIEPQSFIKI